MAQHQVIYFPYLCFKYSPINFGGMILWNFDKEKDGFIKDDPLKKYIQVLLESNTSNSRPIQDIAVFSEKIPNFQYSKRKVQLAGELRLVLFLCVTAHRNTHDGENAGHFMATSENFTHMFQNFQLGGEFTAFTSGSIVQITSGGYKVGEIKYEKPPYVLQGNYRMDEELFSSLKTLKRHNIKIYRRILVASEAFMNGYYNSHEMSYDSRILQQSRAFEVLLQLPEQGQRKDFKGKIKQYCLPRDKQYQKRFRYLSERSGGRKEPETEMKIVMWADKFYTLRNRIIHGDNIKSQDYLFNDQRHWDISLWVYLLLIKKIINEGLGREIFYDEVLWKKEKFVYENGSLYKVILNSLNKYKNKLATV